MAAPRLRVTPSSVRTSDVIAVVRMMVAARARMAPGMAAPRSCVMGPS